VEVQMPAKVHYTNIKYYHNTEKEQVAESVGSHLKHAEYEMRVQRYTPAPLEGSKNHKFMRFKTSR
jgi:predicted ATPase with chaperone activity